MQEKNPACQTRQQEVTEMELSILIARILSVVYLAAALGAILNTEHYRRLSDDMFSNAALTYLMGFTALIVGCLMVYYHNSWEKNWTVLITIVGWIAIIKGILIIAVPGFIRRYSELIFKGKGLAIFPYVAVLAGLLFAYFGFVRECGIK